MRVDFALFGERNGAHELLSTTLLEQSLARAIRGKTDKPSYMPPGFVLSDSIFGFAVESAYVLGRIFPDPGASRSGMVVTIALFVDLDEISRCDDLGSIIRLLPSTKPATCPAAVEIAIQSTEELQDRTEVSRPLLEALIVSGMTKPVAWIDGGFEEELGPIWKLLWPSLRRNFSFRQAFDPQDLSIDQPSIVIVPEAVRSRWSDFLSVQKTSVVRTTIAGDALLNIGVGKNVRDLFSSLDIKEPKLHDLAALANVAVTFGHEAPAVDQVRAALHTIGRLCPEPTAGQAFKSEILIKTALVIHHVTEAAEIRAFRNVDLKPYADSSKLTTALRDWASEHLLDDRSGFVTAVFDERSTIASDLRDGAVEALRGTDSRRAHSVLEIWLSTHEVNRLGILELCLDADLSDSELSDLRWHFTRKEAEGLISCDRLANKPLTALAIASSSLPFQEALVALQLWEAHVNDPRLHMFLQHVDRRAYYRICLEQRFPCAVAAACILVESTVVEHEQSIDAYEAEAITLSMSAGLNSHKFSEGVLRKVAAVCIASGSSFATANVIWPALIERNISLLEQTDRAAYWNKIPDPYRVKILRQTAAEWVKAFETGTAEGPLEAALSDAIWTRARSGNVSVPVLLRLFNELPSIDEQTFIASVLNRDRHSALDRFSAEVLGDIVEQRRWKQAAERLLSEAWHDVELRPVISRCSGQLGRLQRLRVRFLLPSADHTPSLSELWSATEELALELYQWGPGEHNVWERAGGDPSFIKNASTGSESWHYVLSFARNGGGDVSLKSLLTAMTREFWNNDVLQKLLEYAKHVER